MRNVTHKHAYSSGNKWTSNEKEAGGDNSSRPSCFRKVLESGTWSRSLWHLTRETPWPPTASPGGRWPAHGAFLSRTALLSELLLQPAGHSYVLEPKVAGSASEAGSQAAGCGDGPSLIDAHQRPPELAAPKKEVRAGPAPWVIPASCWQGGKENSRKVLA